MTETKSKRRNWVKNAIIIFLVILLILTFFSNTILNRSLPEVAYQYPSSGSITATLRGTGTVAANETYEVTIDEVRKVKAVAIKVGDTVTAGQNIILLDETESTELTAAREALTTAEETLASEELAYQTQLLDLTYTSDSSSSAQLQTLQNNLQTAIANQSKASTKESAVSSAEAAVATAKANLESAKAAQKNAKTTTKNSAEQKALDAAQTAYDNAVAQQTQAKTNLEYVTGVSGGEEYSAVVDNYETAAKEYMELQDKAEELAEDLQELKTAQTQLERAASAVESAQEELEELQASQTSAASALSTVTVAASSVEESSGTSIDATKSITALDENNNTYTLYIYSCSTAELSTQLARLNSWLNDYNTKSANQMVNDDDTDTALAAEIAQSIQTLQESLGSTGTNYYTGTDRVECNGRSYSLNGMTKSELVNLQESIQSWNTQLTDDIADAEQDVKDAQKAQTEVQNETGETAETVYASIRTKEAEIEENEKSLTSKKAEMTSMESTISDPTFVEAYNELLAANELVNTTSEALYEAQTAYNAVYPTVAEGETDSYQEAVDDAEEELKSAEEALSDAESDSALDADSARAAVLSAEVEIENYYNELESQATEAEKADATAQLNLEAQKAKVDAAQTKVDEAQAYIEELEAKASQQIITAEYGGTVTEMNVGAGSYTESGVAMAVIERDDNGYSMSFSVTAEQASKVKAGDQAELVNQYGTDITAVLSNITTDKDNPGTNKLLVFSLTGEDVVAGQSLTVAIGERSESYDLIVPNSAIRTDANGKFVLAISVKSSPLGNRYLAKRVDVEVLASDDNNSAIRGDLSSGDPIITTSSTPIESGAQVRLSE